jgi:hypothetical protein
MPATIQGGVSINGKNWGRPDDTTRRAAVAARRSAIRQKTDQGHRRLLGACHERPRRQ